jgi:hypothetical protein
MEITFETEETVVLREGPRVSLYHCSECGRDVLMATPQAAAFVSRTSEREIFRLIEMNIVHFSENGCVMVCLESVKLLAKRIDER